MITPRFSCSQTTDSLIINIYCPSIRALDIEIHVDETLFILHVNPYFLRLNFSHSVIEDDDSSAKYDPGTGYLTVTLTKAVRGQEFRDLDLLAKLLAPRPTTQAPTIEVISSDTDDELVKKAQKLSLEDQEILEAAQNDWQLRQNITEMLPPLKLDSNIQYGFLDMYRNFFKNVAYTENEVNELGPDAEACLPDQRRSMRRAHEEQKWDEEHYMADFADDEYIQELIAWKHPYAAADPGPIQFTDEENATMLKLPRKEYLTTPPQTHNLYLTLITILFSYAYESRTNQDDPGPESAWTICSLTPAFAALDPPPYGEDDVPDLSKFSELELRATLRESYRRSLAFPLYRSFALAEACKRDVSDWLRRGKRMVFRCLLNVKYILDHHEVYYVYSKIWVDDFCVWIQAYASDSLLLELGSQLKELSMEKDFVGWDLEILEKATQAVLERQSDSDDESSDESDA